MRLQRSTAMLNVIMPNTGTHLLSGLTLQADYCCKQFANFTMCRLIHLKYTKAIVDRM